MIRSALPALLAAAALVAAACGDDDGAGSQDAAKTREDAAIKNGEAAMREDDGASNDAMAATHGAVVKVVRSQYGRVIADRRGEALYLFDREKGMRSRCYGHCAMAWPPLLTAAKPRAGKGANASLLGATRRRSGKLQVTYNGHLLYYFKDDEPGRILCHNVDEFGGLWLVVRPDGDAVT